MSHEAVASTAAKLAVCFGLMLGAASCSGPEDGAEPGARGGSSGSAAPDGSGSSDAQVFVDAHNAVRAAVEKPASYSGSWQPIPAVSWSNEVAATAQAWATHLKDTMSCGLEHAAGSGYGENLAAGSNVDAQRAVDMWAREKASYSYSPEYRFSADTGHYTQIVWRKTTHIGCASASCGRTNVVVCRYDPPGNFVGASVF